METLDLESADRDERLGEAVEEFLTLAESGTAPEPDAFAARYPELGDDLKEALEGLSLLRGLVGQAPGHSGNKLPAGCRLAGYRIVGELGSGGMGVVYEAVHVDLDRPVALKVLDARATRDGNGLRRFLNEAKTAAALHHTHIVPVFDVGHVGGLCYYAMQRIEGSGLDRVVKALRRERATEAGPTSGRRSRSRSWWRTPSTREPELDRTGPSSPSLTATWATEGRAAAAAGIGPPSPPAFVPPAGAAYYRWVAEVGRQAAQALAHAHRRGVVHRDIKPSNLLVDARGSVWVADFGLARRLADPGLTHSESLIGTPRYMSPEQARSQPVDARSDLYSLGATLYELLTLRPPFEGRTAAELLEQIGRDEPASPRRLNRHVPRDLDTIVLKALSKRPQDRYTDALAFAEDLQRFLNLEPVRARRIGAVGRAWRHARRRPALTGVTVGAAAVILAISTIAYLQVVQERDRANQLAAMLQREFREGLLKQATLVRIGPGSERRERGLGLLARAAGLRPDANLRASLRAEAVAFLSLQNVAPRPPITTERSLGLAYGPDGERLATVSEDRATVHFWDVQDGAAFGTPQPSGPPRPERDGPREGDGPGRAGRFPFGFGGARLAAAGPVLAVIWPDGRGVRLFDWSTGSMTADWPTPGREILSIIGAISSAGPRFITIERTRLAPARPGAPRGPADGRQVCLWTPDQTGAPLATLLGPRSDLFPIVATARDGDTLAVAASRGTSLKIHSLVDGAQRGADLDVSMSISALAIDNFNHLAVAGGGAVRLWDLASRNPVASLTPLKNYIASLKFSPDGTLLAVGGFETDVELWSPAANELVAALPTAEPVTELAFAPGGRSLAAGLHGGVALWGIVGSDVRAHASGFGRAARSLAFAPDGALTMAFSQRGDAPAPARIWRPNQCPTSSRDIPGSSFHTVAFDNAGRLAAFDGDDLIWYEPHGLPDALPGSSLSLNMDEDRRHGPPGGPQPRGPQTMARSANGRAFVLTRFNQVYLWRADQPDQLVPLRIASERNGPADRGWWGPPWAHAAISSNADRVYLIGIIGGPGGTFSSELVGLAIHQDQAHRLPWAPRIGRVTAMALSPDGATLALGRPNGSILLIDTSDGGTRAVLPRARTEDDLPLTLAFAPRGDRLAVGTKAGAVLLHQLPRPKAPSEPPLRLLGHRGPVIALAFDANGQRLATSGDDKSVDVWDLDRLGRELDRLGLSW